MRSGWTYPLLGMVAAMVLGASHARAQTVALATGNSFTFDGLTYTISGCQYVLAAVGQSGCGPAGAELEATGSGRNAAIEILDSNASTPLLSLASTAGDTYSDITVGLSITTSTTGRTVTSVTDTLAGTGVSGYPTQVSAAVSSTSTNPNVNLTTSLSQLTDTASFAAYDPTSAAPLTLSVDLKVDAVSGNGGNVGTLTLTSATIQAPEPASFAVFGLALAGLAVARRAGSRSQRSASPPRPRFAA